MEGISVVIISRGRVELLEKLFISVKNAQLKTNIPTEIILVDSSQEKDKESVYLLSRRYNINYYYNDITVSGKRNFGAQKTSYDYILFLDSDCIVTENIFNSYFQTIENHHDAAGSCGPLVFFGEDTWVWKIIESTPYTVFFSVATWGETFIWAPTANILLKKEVFFEVGGFDETFPKEPGGEDADLGIRIHKAGYVMYSSPDALVRHSKTTWSSLKSMFRRVFHYGRGDYSLAERHPDMTCYEIPKRVMMIALGILLYLFAGIFISPWLLIGMLITPIYEILMVCLLLNESHKKTTFVNKIFVQLLFLWNEVGYLKGCLEFRNVKMINKQFIHFKPQLDGICRRNYILSFIYVLYMYITAVLFFIFI